VSTQSPTRASRRRATRRPEAAADTPLALPTRWPPETVERAAGALAAAGRLLFLAWVVALDFRPVTNNDFWYHLRVGEDILATGAVPRVDVYSGIAQGQPFVEQGWLAAVVMALIGRHFRAWAFTLLGDLAGLATAVLLYLAVPRPLRRAPWTLPLLALCFYLTAFAVAVRPVVFAMPILAAFVYCLERWRRTRRARDLVPLVPLELLWANLHGSFLFGPLLLWGLAGCCAALALVPRLQAVPDEAAYGWRDVRQLALVALGCSVALLVTPYGPASVRVALGTWGASDFVRQSMSEWQGPFDAVSYFRDHFEYLFRAYCVLLALLGGALLLRLGERPLLDLAVVAVTVYLSVGANRFIPYAAMFGCPVLVRSGRALAARFKAPVTVAAGELALSAVLLAGTIAVGYPYGTATRGALGWGIAERMPRAEAAFIRERGWSGLLYNEVLTDGSYLLHELYPRVRPVMDAHLGGDERFYAEYEATRSRRDLLTAYLAKYDVRLALAVPGSWIAGHFAADPRWRLALRTPQRLLFVKE